MAVIGSKPAEPLLTHDYVEDIEGRLYVIVGDEHPPNAYFAFLKYIPTNERTPWSRRGTYYARAIRAYGARNVFPASERVGILHYDPILGAEVPILSREHIVRTYHGRDRLREIMSRASDELEEAVCEVVDALSKVCGIGPGSVGVTGSILPGIHSHEVSDIDIVVYGCRASTLLDECVSDAFPAQPPRALERRVVREALLYGLDPSDILRVMPPYKARLLRERELNFVMARDRPRRYGRRVLTPVGVFEGVLEVEPGSCEALMYPGEARVSGRVKVGGCRVVSVITYENFFTYALYLGGRLRLSGVLERLDAGDECVVVVGTRENPGYVIRA